MLFRKYGILRFLPTSQSRAILLILACLITLIYFLDLTRFRTFSLNGGSIPSPPATGSLLQRQAAFWLSFATDLERLGPKCKGVIHPEQGGLEQGFDESHHRERPDILKMEEEQVSCVRRSHTRFVERLNEREHEIPYNKGSRGIVTTAGGPYLDVALMSIRMLRKTGCTLPVEVWLSNEEEFDHDICGDILPSLNTKCMILQDIFDHSGTARSTVKIEKYQYKVMSILFSSFEDVLFLDSDCFPVSDPSGLLDAEPYKSTGLVLWPDFWHPSESPLFFQITGIPAPAIYEHAATESGQILYSKSRHGQSLLLATYYNYYGPTFYYPLQSQGAPGEGDKETFLWSAVALGLPYYKVKTRVTALGYLTKKSEWRGSAMMQVDPVQDWRVTGNDMIKPTSESEKPKPLFIHANFPKFSPVTIFTEKSFGAAGPTRDSDGTIRRVWHDDSAKATSVFGFDFERVLWNEMRELGCGYEHEITRWQHTQNICTNATLYWETLFGNNSTPTELGSGS